MSLVILDYHIISLLRFISWVHYSNSTFCVSLISRLFYDDRVSLLWSRTSSFCTDRYWTVKYAFLGLCVDMWPGSAWLISGETTTGQGTAQSELVLISCGSSSPPRYRRCTRVV